MAIPSRQIGWGTEDNLLWQISKQLQYLIQVTASSLNSFISQTITCGVTDMVPSEDAVCQALLLKQDVLGKIRLSDPNGYAFTDLVSARIYVSQFTSATIYDESYNDGVYIFSVPPGTSFANSANFCNVDTQMQFEDPQGLVNEFDDDCFYSNERNNIFGNINIGGNFLNLSTGNNKMGNVSCTYSFLNESTGDNIMGNVDTQGNDDFLYSSIGNNIIGDVTTNNNFLNLSIGNNTIGNVIAKDDFLANSRGNNIIGDVNAGGSFLASSLGNNIIGDVNAGKGFLIASRGNNTINGEINVGDSAFKSAAPTTRNSVFKIGSCDLGFATSYTGRMDVYYWGDTSGQELPTDIFTTSNLTWIFIRFYDKVNGDADVAQAYANIQAGDPASAIFYNL